MNIYGFGSDLINIDRIKKIIKRNDNFKKRIFTKKEILICEKKKNNYASYAKKFAGKEAFSKALGVGISKGLSFNEIEILNDSNLKLIERNKVLKLKTDQLDQTISNLNTKIKSQSKEIDQIDINQKELEFLRLNLIYSSKCQKTAFKRGYRIGTKEYRSCIYSKGKKIND